MSEEMPSNQTIIWQFFTFMVVEDCITTFTHTLLHSPKLYWIHKKHHEYTTTISIAAEYAHPIEFILSNSIPTIIGFKVLAYFYPVHIVTALTWLIYRILLTSDLHSGF
jgi:sterol desaturase/sphingolipid hydroxylase (fatty acid hydroxylase superfamily)